MYIVFVYSGTSLFQGITCPLTFRVVHLLNLHCTRTKGSILISYVITLSIQDLDHNFKSPIELKTTPKLNYHTIRMESLGTIRI